MGGPFHLNLLVGLLPLYLIGAAFSLPVFTLFIKDRRFYEGYAVANASVAFGMAVTVFIQVTLYGTQRYFFGGLPPPLGISYEVDRLGALLGMVASLIVLVTIIYSTWFMRVKGVEWYYALLLGIEAGSVGVLYTGDFFNLFVMLEVLSMSAYGLVSFYRWRGKSLSASIEYAIVGSVATGLYFLAVVFLYGAFGTLNLADLAAKANYLRGYVNPFSGWIFGNVVVASAVAMALTMWTVTFKSAIFPNYFWLPDVVPEAPTPVSAIFVAVAEVLGVYMLIRFLYTVFPPGSTLSDVRPYFLLFLHILGIISAFIGALVLNIQRDAKKFIAYSTVNQMGFVFMGLTLGTREGVTAGLYHLLSNSFGEALLFYCVGAAIWLRGRSVTDAGALRKNPVLAAGLVVGLLNLFGLPPFMGFFSKYMLFKACLDRGYIVSAVLILVITGISLIGYARFFKGLISGPSEWVRGRSLILPAVIVGFLTAIIILLGVNFTYVIHYLNSVANIAFNTHAYISNGVYLR